MKKNIWLLGLLIFVFAGCKTTMEGDTWSDITSLDQVDGTWVGTHNVSMPLVDALELMGVFGIDFADDPVTMAMMPLIIDNERRSVTMEEAQSPSRTTVEAFTEFQINQNRTKLKGVTDPSEFSDEWGYLIPAEIIFEKQ